MDKKITVSYHKNPFKTDRQITAIEYMPDAPISKYIKEITEIAPEEFDVVHNNRHIEVQECYCLIPAPNDTMSLVPVLHGGGDKESKQMWAMVASVVLSMFTMGIGNLVQYGAMGGAAAAAGMAGWGFWAWAAALATAYVGGQLLQQLFPPPDSDLNQDSPTYGWGPLRPLQGAGNAIQLTFGTVRTAGQLIAQHITTDGEKQYLNILLCGGEGGIDVSGTGEDSFCAGITDIKINDNPVENYEGTTVYLRGGTNDQLPVPNFGDVYSDQFISYKLDWNGNMSWDCENDVPSMNGANETIDCSVGITGGIKHNGSKSIAITTSARDTTYRQFLLGAGGSLNNLMAGLQYTFEGWVYIPGDSGIELSKVNLFLSQTYGGLVHVTGSTLPTAYDQWQKLSATVTMDFSVTEIRAGIEIFQNIHNATFYLDDLSIYSNWPTETTVGDGGSGLEAAFDFPAGLFHMDSDGNSGGNTARIKIQYKLHSTADWLDWAEYTVAGEYKKAFRRVYRLDHLPMGQYDVRCLCTYLQYSGTGDAHDLFWSCLSHIMYDDFARPNKVLLGVKALATDQLSGSQPTVTWLQTRTYVYVWNPNTNSYVQKRADNPAWACYDLIHYCRLLKDIHTGAWTYVFKGVAAPRIDFQAFQNWADFCDSKRCAVNLLLDTVNSLWDTLKSIERLGRGKVIIKGTKYSCVWDSASNPVQLFTISNIKADSFSEQFADTRDRANCVEVTYFDKDRNYERSTILVPGTNYDIENPNPTQLTLYGCDNYEQAYREGRFTMNITENVRRTASWCADVDAIACCIGDVVLVQHQLPNWGIGGRVVSGTTNSVTVDRVPDLAGGVNYQIALRNSNTDELIVKDLAIETSFSRNTPRYDDVGNLIASGVPWYPGSPFGQGIMIEEGTANIIPLSGQKFETGWLVEPNASVVATQNQVVPEWGALDATRIQITVNGNTPTGLKYSLPNIVNPSVLNQRYTASVWVKNIGTSAVIIGSLYGTAYINPGSVGWYIVRVNGNGTGAIDLKISTNTTSDGVDVFLWRPMIELKRNPTTWTKDARDPEFIAIPAEGMDINQGTVEGLFYSSPQSRYTSGGNMTRKIFSINDETDTVLGLLVDQNSNYLYLTIKGSDGNTNTAYLSPSLWSSDGWYRYRMSWSASIAKLELWSMATKALLGQVSLTAQFGGMKLPARFTDCSLGCFRDTSIATAYFNGYHDDIRVSNICRTEAMDLSNPLPSDGNTLFKLEFDGNLNLTGPVLKVSTPFPADKIPQKDWLYAIGQTSIYAKPFRIISITRDGDLRRKLTGIEYIEAIYEDAADIPNLQYAAVTGVINLMVSEHRDDLGQQYVDLLWTPPRSQYYGARVEFDGKKVGEAKVSENSISIPINVMKTYVIKVTTLDGFGNDYVSTATDYTTHGEPPLPNVTGFNAYYNGELLILTWDPLNDLRPVYYEVRKGSDWNTAAVINKAVGLQMTGTGPGRYWIAAYYKAMYSPEPVDILVVTSGNTIVMDVQKEYYESASSWKGTLSDCVLSERCLRLQGDILIDDVSDFDTIADLDFLGNIVSPGYYNIPPEHIPDMGKVENCKLSANVSYMVEAAAGFVGDPTFYASVGIEFRIHDGSDWGDWLPFVDGYCQGRKFDFRAVLTSAHPDVSPVMSEFHLTINMPDKTDKGQIRVPASGIQVPFNIVFHDIPSIQAVMLDTYVGDQLIIPRTLVTLAGFWLQVFDINGNGVERVVNWTAKSF
jgi:predicted phage tail protein